MNINPKIVENTIRQHGILLEHLAKDRLVSTLKKISGSEVKESEVSTILPCFAHKEDKAIELDVFVRSFLGKPLGLISVDINGKKFTTPQFDTVAWLFTDFLVQCKGHSKDGMLIVREYQFGQRDFPIHLCAAAVVVPDHGGKSTHNEKMGASISRRSGAIY